MRYFIILVFFSLSPLSCVTTPADLDCPKLDVILLTIQEKYYPDSIEIRHKVLKEEIYFPKVNVLSITLINPSFEFVDFKNLNPGHRFRNYQFIDSLIHSEFSPTAYSLIENCDLQNIEEIILTIGRIHEDGHIIPQFTIFYPLENELNGI